MVPKRRLGRRFLRPPGLLTIYPHLMEAPSESREQRTEWNVRDSAARVVFVPDSKYCSRGTDFTIEVPISQLNAQRNMESLTASFTSWIVEPSWALKM